MRTPFPAAVAPVDNPQSEAKTELGRLLFYDPLLSSDREVACATCHSELWGMGDGLPLSVGIDGVGAVGPGRTGPNVTTRNAGTLWNVALRASLFWDGRSDTLERQALVPLENAVEMNRDVDELVVDLRALPGYRALFAVAFDGAEPITADNVARALASFERTLISSRGPYDRYAAGDEGALKAEAVDGMFLFAEAGCSDCHVPPLFESERYAARGIGDASDIGREAVTGSAADRGAFRVPTLRNLRETGPYFHDGSVASLEQAVAHEVARSVADGRSRALDESEVRAIATFIHKGLMDRSQEPDRPEEVPSGLSVPLDGFRIVR
jgi:cytochrome c peroxidase